MLPVQVKMPISDTTFVEPDPPTRFKWPFGTDVYPVAVESRNGNDYWFMRKTVNGERHNLYLAPAGRGLLTAELLNSAVRHILGE